MKYISISPEEVESLYRCISLAMDLRDEIEWQNEKQYWSEWDNMSKHIGLALETTNKLWRRNNFQTYYSNKINSMSINNG